jgi:hypothetical protein
VQRLSKPRRIIDPTFLLLALLLAGTPLFAQEEEEEDRDLRSLAGLGVDIEASELPPDAVLEVTPTELTLEVGAKAQLEAVVLDGDGQVLGAKVLFYSRARENVGVNPAGELEAFRPGTHTVVALVPREPGDTAGSEAPLKAEIEVTVPPPPVASVEIVDLPARIWAESVLALESRVVDVAGVERPDVDVVYESDDETVATPDGFGGLVLHRAGTIRITARAETASDAATLEVEPSRVATFELTSPTARARTGDVVFFRAVARDTDGVEVPHLPVHYAVSGTTDHAIVAAGAPAMIEGDGAFVGERSGTYTVVAVSGPHVAQRRIEVEPRKVRKRFELVGHAGVRDRHSSDLWVWEGTDGSDYAITGTWGAEGHAYVWDVSNPESMVLVDTVRVDARTVNDVKVSADGRIAVISREGASNRKNGIVILDVSEPKVGVRILSRYDDQLKGGVHNLFVHDEHVYVVNNSRRFDIVSIEDPTNPYRVGRFELDTPGHGIHDVWVVDGVAFSSNWHDGVVAIDVGGGGKGGAPDNPVLLGTYSYPSGWNHAAYPHRSPSTGKFYVFAGDEAFPWGLDAPVEGQAPPPAAGWIHVVEWESWDHPREVARYEVPGAGTHNMWIEDEVLYVAYYNGGLRAVDISGELRGDLYRQGREIAWWLPHDAEGYVPNAPFTWGPQPFKGHVFFSDWNSGLWAVKLGPLEKPDEVIGEPQ